MIKLKSHSNYVTINFTKSQRNLVEVMMDDDEHLLKIIQENIKKINDNISEIIIEVMTDIELDKKSFENYISIVDTKRKHKTNIYDKIIDQFVGRLNDSKNIVNYIGDGKVNLSITYTRSNKSSYKGIEKSAYDQIKSHVDKAMSQLKLISISLNKHKRNTIDITLQGVNIIDNRRIYRDKARVIDFMINAFKGFEVKI